MSMWKTIKQRRCLIGEIAIIEKHIQNHNVYTVQFRPSALARCKSIDASAHNYSNMLDAIAAEERLIHNVKSEFNRSKIQLNFSFKTV